MKRIDMYLTERQLVRLKEDAAKMGISYSKLVRRILDSHLFENGLKDESALSLLQKNTVKL